MLNDANTNLLYLESKRRKKKKKEKKPRHREWLQNIVSTKGDVNRVKFARGQLRRDLTYQAFTPQPFLRANVLSACFFFFFENTKTFLSQAVHPRIKCQRWYPYEQNSKDAPLHCICEPAFSKHDVCSSWEAQRTGKRPGYKAVDRRAQNNNGLSSV